jgi:hypothetical protein
MFEWFGFWPESWSEPVKQYGTVSISNVLKALSVKKTRLTRVQGFIGLKLRKLPKAWNVLFFYYGSGSWGAI